MILRALSGIRGSLRTRRPRPAILMYHRIASIRHDPWGLAVSPEHFSEQMEYLRRHRTPLAMEEFVDRLRSQKLQADDVAVTFDDGYRDNLIHGKPVLATWKIPATVFLTTASTDKPLPFWWDELTTMILAAARHVHYEQICAGKVICLEWGRPEKSDIAASWRAWDPPTTARQSAYLEIWRQLQRATASERERVMTSLRTCLASDDDAAALPMNANEVRAIVENGLIDIGAHTVTHPALTALTQEDCRREIRESAQRCRELKRNTVHGFAYPFGDLNSGVREEVKDAGFLWACSTRHEFADSKFVDMLALPRIAIPDASTRPFARLITSN